MKYINIQVMVNTNQPFSADGANYIEFVNQGDGVVMVDNLAIYPNGSFAPALPVPGDEDFSQYRITFEQPATIYRLVVTRKIFIRDAV